MIMDTAKIRAFCWKQELKTVYSSQLKIANYEINLASLLLPNSQLQMEVPDGNLSSLILIAKECPCRFANLREFK